MKNLDHLVIAAREGEPSWDDARASRVLSSAVALRQRREARSSLVRRAIVVGSAAAVIGLFFLRGASASPSSSSSTSAEVEPAPAQLAASAFGDAGYAHD